MYLSLLFQIENSQWWEASRILNHQLHQLQQLLKHAIANVPFYGQRLQPLRDSIENGISSEDLLRIPILTRQDVQQNEAALTSILFPSSHGRQTPVATSGSTGQPVTIGRTQLHSLVTGSMILRYHKWHKRDLEATNVSIRTLKRGEIGPRLQLGGWSQCFPTGPAVVYDISTPTDELLKYLVHDNPAYLQTHPSTLLELVKRSSQLGTVPNQLREVRTFGEVVDDDLRQHCRQAWNVPLSDNYSCQEFGAIALQCPEYEHYHASSESVLVEILDDQGKPCQPGETGRVVLSHLHNFATPLIRYEVGDMAEVGAECPCGRGLPVINRILGRVRNLVVLPNGRRVHPSFIAKEILEAAPLKQYQVIQKSIEDVEVRYVMDEALNETQTNSLIDYFNQKFSRRLSLPVHAP